MNAAPTTNGDRSSVPAALPAGWASVVLSDLLDGIEAGKSFKCFSRPANAEEWGVIKVSAMTWGEFDEAEQKAVPSRKQVDPRHEIRAGDLLLSRSNTPELVGASVYVRQCRPRLLLSDKSMRLLVRSGIDAAWLHKALSSPSVRGQLSAGATGTSNSMRNVSQEKVLALRLLVPPTHEQRRIVEKVERLFSALDAGVAVLERAKTKLKAYRSAVLKAAIEGRLTEEWRSKHEGMEPAAELLKRVLNDRRKKWEEQQRARFTAAGKVPPKNWQEKYPQRKRFDVANLPDLPIGWCWGRVSDVGEVQLGRQRSPNHHRGEHMRPYLRVANVYEDRIDTSDVMSMNFTPAEYETYRLEVGDILLNEGQSLEWVGRPAMYRGEVPGSCFQNTLVRFRAHPPVLPLFALYVFRAYLHNKRFQKVARWTVNIAHLGADRFGQIEFPIPPIAEQQQIVAEIEARLTVVSKLEAQIAANLDRAARLRQSILKRAFEGKLVAQDPADEPIAAALARVRQQQVGAASGGDEAQSVGKNRPADTRETFYRRGSLVTYVIQQLADDPSFGRTKLEKVLYLAQTHLEIPLALEFERQAAGPFDKVIYKLEGAARKQEWFQTKKRRPNAKPGDRFKDSVTYQPGTKGQPLIDHATQVLGEKRDWLDRMLGHMKQLNTDEAELLATIYAAWNDLLIDARPAELGDIVREVHGWHASKKRFTPKQIETRIAWMRKFGYVPVGRGQRTKLLDRKSKVPPKRKGRRG